MSRNVYTSTRQFYLQSDEEYCRAACDKKIAKKEDNVCKIHSTKHLKYRVGRRQKDAGKIDDGPSGWTKAAPNASGGGGHL